MPLQIFSDSSAAKAFAPRRGLGRQRYVQTRYLWFQERVAAAQVSVQKVKGTQNPADIHIKAASRETLNFTGKCWEFDESKLTAARKKTQAGEFGQTIRQRKHNNLQSVQITHSCVSRVANLQSCQGQEQVNSRDFGSAGLVSRTGKRME